MTWHELEAYKLKFPCNNRGKKKDVFSMYFGVLLHTPRFEEYLKILSLCHFDF
jgi:hypothetical protein